MSPPWIKRRPLSPQLYRGASSTAADVRRVKEAVTRTLARLHLRRGLGKVNTEQASGWAEHGTRPSRGCRARPGVLRLVAAEPRLLSPVPAVLAGVSSPGTRPGAKLAPRVATTPLLLGGRALGRGSFPGGPAAMCLSSPCVAMSSPWRAESSPQSAVSSPQRAVSSPWMVTSSLQWTVSSPHRAVSSPCVAISSPQRAESSPQSAVSSPWMVMSSPQWTVSSPHRDVSSPCEAIGSLRRAASSPQRAVSSSWMAMDSTGRALSSHRGL